jgi:hypothetical protein
MGAEQEKAQSKGFKGRAPLPTEYQVGRSGCGVRPDLSLSRSIEKMIPCVKKMDGLSEEARRCRERKPFSLYRYMVT